MLKLKLKKNKLNIGTWITLSDPLIPEILSPAGFDWMCIDIEHTSLSLDQVKQLIISIENQNTLPLVRVGENNHNLIKRVMDIGSSGIIIPNINNYSEAKMAINAVKYPPKGQRGMGLYKAQSYGIKLKEYIKWNKKNSIVIIQIESQEALDNIDDIFSLKEIDAFFVGPYDLSASMNIPGKFDDKKFKNALNKILSSAHKNKITAGIHSVSSDYNEVKKYIKQGFRMIAYSVDAILLADSAIQGMSKIKK